MTSFTDNFTINGITLTAQPICRQSEILTPEALAFVAKLHKATAGRRQELLQARQERRQQIAKGQDPRFLRETESVRNDPNWRVAPPAPGLEDRRVEITGPTDRKMTINALNSGAKVWLADMEDATTPTWRNVIDGQLNLHDALERRIDFTSPEGKEYKLAPGRGTAHDRGPPPRLAPAGEAHAHRRHARLPAGSSTSGCTSSTTPAA